MSLVTTFRSYRRSRRSLQRAFAVASAASRREAIVIAATERAGLQPRL